MRPSIRARLLPGLLVARAKVDVDGAYRRTIDLHASTDQARRLA